MFTDFIGFLGETINATIDAYNAIDNERAELVEAIRKYNERAVLYGKKPIVIAETTTSNNEMTQLKKYFSEKRYDSHYKAENDLIGFGFQRVSRSTFRKAGTIATIEYDTEKYGHVIKLF